MSISESNQHYVYVYLDTRKPGKFIYGDYEFDYEPFYVGIGYANRYKHHLYKSNMKQCGNTLKVNKIKKIIKETGEIPIINKQFKNLLVGNAKTIETKMIKTIGRINLGTGPLTNLTDGGEQNGNRIISKKDRKNRSERIKGKNNPNYGGMSDDAKLTMSKNHANVSGENNPRYGVKIPKEQHPMFNKKQSSESIYKIQLNRSLYYYEVLFPDGRIFKNILVLNKFLTKYNIGNRSGFKFINNIGKYKGHIIKRFKKEKQ